MGTVGGDGIIGAIKVGMSGVIGVGTNKRVVGKVREKAEKAKEREKERGREGGIRITRGITRITNNFTRGIGALTKCFHKGTPLNQQRWVRGVPPAILWGAGGNAAM